jgi:hypothetical protein
MVDKQPADFHPVPGGQTGQVERDADVLNSPDFNYRPAAAVFENDSELFPMAGIRRAGEGVTGNPVSFVSFHHGA